MKFLVIAVINLVLSCLLSLAFGKVDHYTLAIEEKGTRFSQEIDVDRQKNVEVFRVPAHNNINGADFYHDFKMGLTITKVPSRKVCYLSQMDQSLPSPGKLKEDLVRTASAASQAENLPVETKSSVMMVTGPANRFLLTKDILDFCGVLPIYNTEVYPDASKTSGIAVIESKRLIKRQAPRTETTQLLFFNRTCKSMKDVNGQIDYSRLNNCKNENDRWDVACTFKDGLCFYFVTCKYLSFPRKQWECKEIHARSAIPVCCDLVCQN